MMLGLKFLKMNHFNPPKLHQKLLERDANICEEPSTTDPLAERVTLKETEWTKYQEEFLKWCSEQQEAYSSTMIRFGQKNGQLQSKSLYSLHSQNNDTNLYSYIPQAKIIRPGENNEADIVIDNPSTSNEYETNPCNSFAASLSSGIDDMKRIKITDAGVTRGARLYSQM